MRKRFVLFVSVAACTLIAACGGSDSVGPDQGPGTVQLTVATQGTGSQPVPFRMRLSRRDAQGTPWKTASVGGTTSFEGLEVGTYVAEFDEALSSFCWTPTPAYVVVPPGGRVVQTVTLDCVGQFLYMQGTVVHWVDPEGRDTPLPLTETVPSRIMSVSPDGRRFITSDFSPRPDSPSYIWDLEHMDAPVRVEGRLGDWSPDGRYISGREERRLIIVDAHTYERLGRYESPIRGSTTGGTWSPDGASVAYSDIFRIFRFDRASEEHRLVGAWDERAPLQDLNWSPGGLLLARVFAPDAFYVIDPETGTLVREFAGLGPARPRWLDATRFVAIQAPAGHLFDLTTGRKTLLTPQEYIGVSSISPADDLDHLIFTNHDPTGVFWLDRTTGDLRQLVDGEEIWFAAWLPYSKGLLVTGG